MITNNDTDYTVISAKVGNMTLTALESICARLNCTKYELLQMVINALVRYIDSKHRMTPEIEKMIHVFESLQGWRDSVNLADPTNELYVVAAIYFLAAKPKPGEKTKTKSPSSIYVETPFFGQPVTTQNVQEMCEKFFCLVFPSKYRHLRIMATQLGTNSVIETIDAMMSEVSENPDDATLREMFGDNDRDTFGRHSHPGIRYVRHNNKPTDGG